MDSVNNLKAVIAVAVGSSTSDNTAITGATVDRLGFETVTFVLATGTLADADATFAVKLQHGSASDLSDATDVTDADLIGDFSGFKYDDDNKVFKLGYAGAKRYVRIVVTPSSNSGAAPMCGVAILGKDKKYPIA